MEAKRREPDLQANAIDLQEKWRGRKCPQCGMVMEIPARDNLDLIADGWKTGELTDDLLHYSPGHYGDVPVGTRYYNVTEGESVLALCVATCACGVVIYVRP